MQAAGLLNTNSCFSILIDVHVYLPDVAANYNFNRTAVGIHCNIKFYFVYVEIEEVQNLKCNVTNLLTHHSQQKLNQRCSSKNKF